MAFPTQIKRVIIIAEENKDYSTVMGNAYFAGLANTYTNLTGYKNILHPSQPNYFAITSGSSQGCTNDSCSTKRNVNNVFRLVTNAGLTWGAWIESGSPTKHNPAEFYSDSYSGQKDFSDFQTNYIAGSGTPPNFCFVSPNLANDAHDGTLATAATWLQNTFKLATLQSKSWASETAFIIWFDESGSGSFTYCCIISPISKGITSNISYNHYNTLATVEWLLGLGNCGNNDATAVIMKDLFGAGGGCIPNWQCRIPLNGYLYDVNNCGFADKLDSTCSPGGGGGGGVGGGVCDIITCPPDKNYCLVGRCIPKKYVLYGGIGLGVIIVLKMVLKSK